MPTFLISVSLIFFQPSSSATSATTRSLAFVWYWKRSISRISSSVRKRRRNEASRSAARTSNICLQAMAFRPAELADFVLAGIVVSLADVVPDLETEVVRIEAALDRTHDLIVADEEFEMEILRKFEAVEDLAVPVARPPLVHDLGLDLRNEVLRLLVNDRQQILLPLREERVVVAHEDQEVFFWRRWNLLEVGLLVRLGVGGARRKGPRGAARRRSAAGDRTRRRAS